MAKSYAGDLSATGGTVELKLQDQPGSGGAGAGNVIAPIAFGRPSASSASGNGISWVYTAGTPNDYAVTFDTARANTNYAVITDVETSDEVIAEVTNKTTTGFNVSISDAGTPSRSTDPFSVIVYDEDPTVEVIAAGGVIIQSAVDSFLPVAEQVMSPSVWADIDGSDSAFTPGSGISKLLYRYEFPAKSANTGAFDLILKLLVDGVDQTGSIEYNYVTNGGERNHNYSFLINSWGTSAKTIKLQGKVKESYQSAVVHPEMETGVFRQARLTITEYS